MINATTMANKLMLDLLKDTVTVIININTNTPNGNSTMNNVISTNYIPLNHDKSKYKSIHNFSQSITITATDPNRR